MTLLTAVSCDIEGLSEINMKNEEISLSLKGVVLLQYDSRQWQIGYNGSRNEYRIHDDNMGEYFIVTCSEAPSFEGQTFKADLTYTANSAIARESGLTFEVQKLDGAGRIWLWNKSKKYGIVIKQP